MAWRLRSGIPFPRKVLRSESPSTSSISNSIFFSYLNGTLIPDLEPPPRTPDRASQSSSCSLPPRNAVVEAPWLQPHHRWPPSSKLPSQPHVAAVMEASPVIPLPRSSLGVHPATTAISPGMRLPRSSPTFVSKLEGPRQWFSRSFAAVSNPKEENKTEFSRSFASASKPKEEKKIELPIQVYGVFGNYASALFLSAAKAGVLDQVESEFLEFAEAAKNSPSFSRFVKNLAVPQKTTVKAMTDICAHIELSHIVKNCLLLMAENGRLRYLEDVAKCFVQLTRARRGEVDAIVTSASPLPPDQVKEVTAAVQEILGGGKKIFLKQKVDPGLIGGLVLEFDNRSIDLSIQTRLNKMKEIMLKDF